MKTALRHTLIACALLSASSLAVAGPNFITNGSFENGLTGWTMVGTPTVASGSSTPPVAITYGSATPYPTGAFGEAVPAPTDLSRSPDAIGTHGAYFVDDNAVNEGLSQVVFLTAGTYQIGFDVYAPGNGFSNPNDAHFSATIAGMTLTDFLVSSQPAMTWLSEAATVSITADGFYDTSFIFNTPGLGAAKDVVVDRAFIIATDAGGGVTIGAIPEPGTLALGGIAVAAYLLARRRKPRA
jgi:PEP-CTERM motif